MKDYKGKVAVITGAGRGIGRGIAIRCAKEGMKVVLAGYGTESIGKTASDLNDLGAKTLIVQTDVSMLADVEALANQAFEKFGQVDLLVNNAGVAAPGNVLENSINDWHWVMGVNFYGVLYCIKTFVNRMMSQNTESRIVNVSSLAGISRPGGSYGVSKHAVVQLSEALYDNLVSEAPHVKVSVLCPGWVDTEFDTINRSRPERFSNQGLVISDERQQDWKESLSNGLSIEQTADALFKGMANDQLYIGPKTFQHDVPNLEAELNARVKQIVNETNP